MSMSPTHPAVRTLSAYVDGELSPRARVATEQHLAGCAPCTARVADLHAVGLALRHHVEAQVEQADFSDFASEVLARLTPQRPSLGERLRVSWEEWRSHRPTALVGGVGLAMAAAVAFLLVPGALDGLQADAHSKPTILSVSTDEQAHVAPVVLKTEGGDAIIWLVDHPDRPSLSLGMDASVPEVAPPPPVRPKGGEL
jgi:anti-sigma factor RsiW